MKMVWVTSYHLQKEAQTVLRMFFNIPPRILITDLYIFRGSILWFFFYFQSSCNKNLSDFPTKITHNLSYLVS